MVENNEFTDKPPQDSPESVAKDAALKDLEEVETFFSKLQNKYSSKFKDALKNKEKDKEMDFLVPSASSSNNDNKQEHQDYEVTVHPDHSVPQEVTQEEIIIEEPIGSHTTIHPIAARGTQMDSQEDLYPEPNVAYKQSHEKIDPYEDATQIVKNADAGHSLAKEVAQEEHSEHVIDEPDVLEIESSLSEQFAQAIRKTKITPKSQLLITEISECYNKAKRLMRKRKYEDAQSEYTIMLRHYQDLKKQRIPDIHKHIAHHGLEELYEELKLHQDKNTLSTTSFITMVVASVIVMLVGITLVVNPSISGLVVLENSLPEYTGPTSFEIFGPRKVDLGSSFSISSSHLTLLSSRSAHVDVQVDGTSLVIVPEPGFQGEEMISVIGVSTVSEPYRMTKVPLKLIVR